MRKEELIQELIRAKINEEQAERVCHERSECAVEIYSLRPQEDQIIMKLSGRFPVALLCKLVDVSRSSFYNQKQHLSHPLDKTKRSVASISLFRAYHPNYASHGYRWLNVKILLDTGLVLSDPTPHKL